MRCEPHQIIEPGAIDRHDARVAHGERIVPSNRMFKESRSAENVPGSLPRTLASTVTQRNRARDDDEEPVTGFVGRENRRAVLKSHAVWIVREQGVERDAAYRVIAVGIALIERGCDRLGIGK